MLFNVGRFYFFYFCTGIIVSLDSPSLPPVQFLGSTIDFDGGIVDVDNALNAPRHAPVHDVLLGLADRRPRCSGRGSRADKKSHDHAARLNRLPGAGAVIRRPRFWQAQRSRKRRQRGGDGGIVSHRVFFAMAAASACAEQSSAVKRAVVGFFSEHLSFSSYQPGSSFTFDNLLPECVKSKNSRTRFWSICDFRSRHTASP